MTLPWIRRLKLSAQPPLRLLLDSRVRQVRGESSMETGRETPNTRGGGGLQQRRKWQRLKYLRLLTGAAKWSSGGKSFRRRLPYAPCSEWFFSGNRRCGGGRCGFVEKLYRGKNRVWWITSSGMAVPFPRFWMRRLIGTSRCRECGRVLL